MALPKMLEIELMFHEQRLGNDETETSRPCKPDDGDNQTKEKDNDIAHPGLVSKPEKTSNFGGGFNGSTQPPPQFLLPHTRDCTAPQKETR